MLHFLVDVLEILSAVSRKFQSQTACVSEVLTEIEVAVISLEKMKERNGLKLRKALLSVPDELTGDDRSFISARQKLLTAIVQSLQRRFTDNPGILATVSTFNLSLFPSDAKDLKDFGDEEVDKLVDQFSSALEDAGVDVHRIAHEWTKLKQLMPARFTGPVQNITWADVNSRLGKVCPNVLALVDLVHTIPASSADAERIQLITYTKSNSRNKLLDTNLSNQLMVVLETEAVGDYGPTEAVQLWNSAVMRRPRQNTEQSVKGKTAITTSGSQSAATGQSMNQVLVLDSENEEQIRNLPVSVSQHQVLILDKLNETQNDSELNVDNSKEAANNNSDENNNLNSSDVNNNDNKQDKLVGSDQAIPIFSTKGTQTESNYSSDCDFYENEYDKDLYEKQIQYEDRLKLAKKSYEEFLNAMNFQT